MCRLSEFLGAIWKIMLEVAKGKSDAGKPHTIPERFVLRLTTTVFALLGLRVKLLMQSTAYDLY
jgi:hypothetical protein